MMKLVPVGKGGMTAAELKVLEARIDMLDAVLQDLIDHGAPHAAVRLD